jgi:hypothetical protein
MSNARRSGETLKALIDLRSEAFGGLGAVLGDVE